MGRTTQETIGHYPRNWAGYPRTRPNYPRTRTDTDHDPATLYRMSDPFATLYDPPTGPRPLRLRGPVPGDPSGGRGASARTVSDQLFHEVLEATGYLIGGQPAPGVTLGEEATANLRFRSFKPDGKWRGESALTVYFKLEPEPPSEERIATWRREIWNEGQSPLLWVISQNKIDLYNGFARPRAAGDAKASRLRTFAKSAGELDELDLLAGRFAMETGRFWEHDAAKRVHRRTSVSQQLSSDLASLERDLLHGGMLRLDAQGLIGRSIFVQYLVDREIATPEFLNELCGRNALSDVLRDARSAEQLFDWLHYVFDGDMFPINGRPDRPEHLRRVADFLDAVDPRTGQRTLFPYQFDIIPVELISSIFEQFVQADPTIRGSAGGTNVHCTRLSLVSLVLDEVMVECVGHETVLDWTCGSGVFLVEAFRRLVTLRAGGKPPSGLMIRYVLHEQVFGLDISEAAIKVAAFSLYLAALDLDPNPQTPQALAFWPLIGKTLFVGDVRMDQHKLTAANRGRKFDLIVGNPPWRSMAPSPDDDAPAPRGTSLIFVNKTMEYGSHHTRLGLVLGVHHFFGRAETAQRALQQIIEKLAPLTLVNLSNLSTWLFPKANMPGMILFARHRRDAPPVIKAVQAPWSPAGAKSHTFDLAPSDVTTLPIWDWKRDPRFLKGAVVGTHRDLTLVDDLWRAHGELKDELQKIGTRFRTGLTQNLIPKREPQRGDVDPGAEAMAQRLERAAARLRVKPARLPMHGLPWLTGKAKMTPLSLPTGLPRFDGDCDGAAGQATRPRNERVYRAPVLIVREMLLKDYMPRIVAAVAERDTVYSNAYFGVSFPRQHGDVAHLLAGILSSSLASWFLLMTGSALGLGKRRVMSIDVGQMPVPDLAEAASSEVGRRIVDRVRELGGQVVTKNEWRALDEEVFKLYKLRPSERIVVQDGIFRATWQWKAGRDASVAQATTENVVCYAKAFASVIDVWLRASNSHRMRAEVFDLPLREPYRVVRFVVEDQPGPSIVEVASPDGNLRQLLDRIGERLESPLTNDLVGQREVRAYESGEVVIVKPAARRHWMGVCALGDADELISGSLRAPRVLEP